MEIKVSGFLMPHHKEKFKDCADRYAFSHEKCAFALADGVGGSLCPEYMSSHLVQDYVSSPDTYFDKDSLLINSESQRFYEKDFYNYVTIYKSKLSRKKLMIFELKEERVQSSSSTFVGFNLKRNGDKVICNYYSLGDSYLFYISKENEFKSIASMEGKEHDNFPEYFSSDSDTNGVPVRGSFPIEDNSHLLLMSDALSDWFIKEYKENPDVLEKLLTLKTHKDFEEFVISERANKKLDDDDTTMMIVSVYDVEIDGNKITCDNVDDINMLIQDDLEEEKSNLINDIERIGRDQEKEKANLKQLGRKVQDAQEKLNSVNNDIEKQKLVLENVIKEIEKKNKNLDDIKSSIKEQSDKLEEISKEVRNANQGMQQINANVTSLADSIKTQSSQDNGVVQQQRGDEVKSSPDISVSKFGDIKKKILSNIGLVNSILILVLFVLQIITLVILIHNINYASN